MDKVHILREIRRTAEKSVAAHSDRVSLSQKREFGNLIGWDDTGHGGAMHS